MSNWVTTKSYVLIHIHTTQNIDKVQQNIDLHYALQATTWILSMLAVSNSPLDVTADVKCMQCG